MVFGDDSDCPAVQPSVCQDSDTCAICFEELASLGGAVPLPCACRALYCHGCWDYALNSKFDQAQVAECPSCRRAMRVDFDAETGRLCFSLQALDAGRDEEMRARLQEQAKPRQVRLLKDHGGRLAAGDLSEPACVCGSSLMCISVQERVLAIVARSAGVRPEDAETAPDILELTAAYLNGTLQVPLTCDICSSVNGSERMDAEGLVWTCKAGPQTIIHGLSFDVCESCYDRHIEVGRDQ